MDLHANLAASTLATPPDGTSGTSLVVGTGHGARFPAAPFNVLLWPASVAPTYTNAEIVRVTAKASDTFTVTRAQEGTSARTFATNDQIALTVTKKMLTDIEYGAHGIFNVKDPVYGATGDGATDDAAAIQAAIDAAAAVFGTVYIPFGTYRFGTTLDVPSAVSIYGAGMDVTSLVFTPTTGNAIEITGVTDGVKHHLEGFTLAPLTTNTGTGINCTQFKFSTVTRVRVRSFAVGVALTDSYYSSFLSCAFDTNTQDGVNLDLDANALAFINCAITDNARAGVYVRGGRSVLISGGSLESNLTGLYVTADTDRATANITVANTYFEGNTFTDVWVRSLNSGTTKPKSVTIRDCYFQPLTAGTLDAITVYDHDGVTVTGCTFDNLASWSYAHSLYQTTAGTSPVSMRDNVDKSTSKVLVDAGYVLQDGTAVSADRGDADATLTVNLSAPVQRWATTLTANRTVTLSTTGARNGDGFRVVRTGLGAFTLDVGGLKTIPSATAAFVDVSYNGSAWVLTGYGTL